jgi:predicted AAA+ superfamily ATPase
MASKETKEALMELRKAFFKLLDVLEKNDEWEELAGLYPFHKSFDELTLEVAHWVDRHVGD